MRVEQPAWEVALYWLPEELVAGHGDAAQDEEGAGPAVEQPEGPVVDGRFPLSYLDNTTAVTPHLPGVSLYLTSSLAEEVAAVRIAVAITACVSLPVLLGNC